MPVEIMKRNDNVRFGYGFAFIEINTGENSKASCMCTKIINK
jgi:hypothetical protein